MESDLSSEDGKLRRSRSREGLVPAASWETRTQEPYSGKELGVFKKPGKEVTAEERRGRGQEMSWRRKARGRKCGFHPKSTV